MQRLWDSVLQNVPKSDTLFSVSFIDLGCGLLTVRT